MVHHYFRNELHKGRLIKWSLSAVTIFLCLLASVSYMGVLRVQAHDKTSDAAPAHKQTHNSMTHHEDLDGDFDGDPDDLSMPHIQKPEQHQVFHVGQTVDFVFTTTSSKPSNFLIGFKVETSPNSEDDFEHKAGVLKNMRLNSEDNDQQVVGCPDNISADICVIIDSSKKYNSNHQESFTFTGKLTSKADRWVKLTALDTFNSMSHGGGARAVLSNLIAPHVLQKDVTIQVVPEAAPPSGNTTRPQHVSPSKSNAGPSTTPSTGTPGGSVTTPSTGTPGGPVTTPPTLPFTGSDPNPALRH